MQWPGYRDGLWSLLRGEACRDESDLAISISGADASIEAIAAARENCLRAGLSDTIDLQHCPLAEQPVHQPPGLLVSNPPYGKRLPLAGKARDYYAELGRQIARAYPGWQAAMLCPDPALVMATALPFREIARLDNGGLDIGLFATPRR